MKVQAESFHLNGHIVGFRSQTRKFKLPYKTPSNTLAVVRWNWTILANLGPSPSRTIPSVRSRLLVSWFSSFVFFATLRNTGQHSSLLQVVQGYHVMSIVLFTSCIVVVYFPLRLNVLSLIITIKTKNRDTKFLLHQERIISNHSTYCLLARKNGFYSTQRNKISTMTA